jgi:hypothetical protein
VKRIDERVRAVFGCSGVPELLRPDEFARLAEITPTDLLALVKSGVVSANPETSLIPRQDYYRYMFERNLRRAGVSEELISHVLDCTS